MRLPDPRPAVKRALALLPHRPGVYILRDETGRVIYVGRSGDLATRARSYWQDLRDRPHLVRMLQRVEWLEPVVCTSEHEAAFLESDLLDRHRTRWNRTLGMESRVWLRLDCRPATADLQVVHEPAPRDGARWFGPYLGWEPTRLAASSLLRLFPLRYTGAALSRTERELARSLGVAEQDSAAMASRIERVLRRDRAAVRAAIRELEAARARAARRLMFEFASEIHEEIRGLRWIVEPQKLSLLDPVDADFAAVAGSVRVVIALRGGRMAQRHVFDRYLPAQRGGQEGPSIKAVSQRSAVSEWLDLARENAELMSRLAAADAIGPLGWKRVRA
ncbi:MAG TPA: GIY-YIG nuclease family protein [Myxococcaceae bacterium]